MENNKCWQEVVGWVLGEEGEGEWWMRGGKGEGRREIGKGRAEGRRGREEELMNDRRNE